MIHIYMGDGKGKTTAAVGAAVRAKGAGKKVVFCQFLKNGTSSEISMLDKLGITVDFCPSINKFLFQMTEHEKLMFKIRNIEILNAIDATDADVIILDEFLDAYNENIIDRQPAQKFITEFTGEIIMTGREAPQEFIDIADYITVMTKIRHPYDNGTPARKGIEF